MVLGAGDLLEGFMVSSAVADEMALDVFGGVSANPR
jgi:hypothetical protein